MKVPIWCHQVLTGEEFVEQYIHFVKDILYGVGAAEIH